MKTKGLLISMVLITISVVTFGMLTISYAMYEIEEERCSSSGGIGAIYYDDESETSGVFYCYGDWGNDDTTWGCILEDICFELRAQEGQPSQPQSSTPMPITPPAAQGDFRPVAPPQPPMVSHTTPQPVPPATSTPEPPKPPEGTVSPEPIKPKPPTVQPVRPTPPPPIIQ